MTSKMIAIAMVMAAAATASADPGIVQVSPTPFVFPTVRADAGQATLTLTVSNIAGPTDDPLDFQIDAHSIWNDPLDFTVSASPFGFVGPGESLTFTVTFHPQHTGSFDAPIVLRDFNTHDVLATVPFHAEGGQPILQVVSPASGILDLGPVPVGQTVSGTVVARNAGNVDLFVWNTSVSPGFGGTFTLSGGPPPQTHIAPGGLMTFTVTCTPDSFMGASSDLYIDTDADFTPFISISCDGLGAALITEPPQVLFGDVVAGTPVTQQIVVRNWGDADTTLVAVTPDDPRLTVAPGALPIDLAAGAETVVAVTFTPTDGSDLTGSVTFDAASGEDVTMMVFGDGIAASVDPLVVDFGNHSIGTTTNLSASMPDAISIRNLDPSASFSITSVTITGDSDFALVGPDATELAPGTRAELDVRFAPIHHGHLAATIAIFAGGATEPFARIEVTGYGFGPFGCSAGGGSGLAVVLGVLLVVTRRRRVTARSAAS
jgi:uncharacterized protein (TIGR03382 family)